VKGQAAIEYMIVIGIALVLSLPFIINAQESMVELRSGTSNVAVQDSLNDLEMAVETVSASGEPARRTFPVTFPDSLNSTTLHDSAVVVVVNSPTGTNTYTRTFEVNITGDLPDSSGRYMLRTEATSEAVNIEVVE